MSEQAQTPSPGAKPKPIQGSRTPTIDAATFSKFEIPAPFRDFVEKSASQAKEACARMKSTADEMTERLEEAYMTATRGANEYGFQLLEANRAHANAAFDYAISLLAAKSLSEVVELSTAHLRKQFRALTNQSKELTSLAQKVASETAQPIKEGVNKAFKQAA